MSDENLESTDNDLLFQLVVLSEDINWKKIGFSLEKKLSGGKAKKKYEEILKFSKRAKWNEEELKEIEEQCKKSEKVDLDHIVALFPQRSRNSIRSQINRFNSKKDLSNYEDI